MTRAADHSFGVGRFVTQGSVTSPGAPTGVTAIAGNASASIAFTAPSSNGGSAILDYTATMTPASGSPVSATGTSSPISVTGLTNGVSYTPSVKARNTAASGSAGSGAAITPTSGSVAPTITSASSGSTPENVAFSLALTADQSVAWALTGGADRSKFTLTGSTLSLPAENFESPSDSDVNNVYAAQVTATNGASQATVQNITVTVTNVNDTNPSAFAFTAATSVPVSTAETSNAITISGMGASDMASAAVSGATSSLLSKNGGAFASGPVTVANGDTLAVRHTSSSSSSTATSTTLSVGATSATFTSTTAAVTPVAPSAVILGMPTATAGQLSIPWTDGAPGSSAIDGHFYSIGTTSGGEGAMTAASFDGSGNLIITGLAIGQYWVEGYTHNSVGYSPVSNEVSSTVTSAPSNVTDLTDRSGNQLTDRSGNPLIARTA